MTPATGQRVFVAIYEHQYGDDVCVFATRDQADAWRREIAEEYWEDVSDEEFDPETSVDVWWEAMSECFGAAEYFTVYERTVI